MFFSGTSTALLCAKKIVFVPFIDLFLKIVMKNIGATSHTLHTKQARNQYIIMQISEEHLIRFDYLVVHIKFFCFCFLLGLHITKLSV